MSKRGSSEPRSVFTDGACSGNPGRGGWAWALDKENFASGFAEHTTNQRMEISAAFEAVQALEGPLEVVSDSTYVVNCFKQRWWQGWLARGWLNSQRKPVANRDLWEPFIELVRRRGNVSFRWVKGHSGHTMNDFVDQLAVEALQRGAGRSQGLGTSQSGAGKQAGQASAPSSKTPPRASKSEKAQRPVAHLVCGSTAAGKTTYATKLATEKGALRFSIDEWMKTLFLPDTEDIVFEWMMERIARCERQIQSLCEQSFQLGHDVVLDLGFSTREHRDRFRHWADRAGASSAVHYLDVPASERRDRVRCRNERREATFAMTVTDEMFDFMEDRFEPPTEDELANGAHIRPASKSRRR